MAEPKPNIPKFGSFKPKPTPAAHDLVEVEDRLPPKSGRNGHKEIGDHRDNRSSRKSHSKEHRRDRSRDRHRSRKHAPLLETRKPSPEPVGIFTIDRKGDLKNLEFGSIHRYSVPSFYRTGAGRVMGMPSHLRIDRDYGDDKGLILNDRTGFISNRQEKYIFAKIEKERPRLLKIRPQLDVAKPAIQEAEFISLQSTRGKKRKRSADDPISEDEETDYRSIHGKAKPRNEPEDEDLQFATDSELSGSESGNTLKLDSATREKNAELSRHVERNPDDLSAWLSLIEHQDTMLRAAGDQRRTTSAEIQSTAEIKIHMYEKALEKTRSLRDRETLVLGMMMEGSKIWEIVFQSEKWEKISAENIDSILLWKSYLDFKQTTFGAFQYEEIRDIFVKRIKLLLSVPQAAPNEMSLRNQIIYVILRLTAFMRDAGYAEQAVAVWQGILEFNFFAPPVPPGEKLELFKEFWESEVPRIGEEAAMGWLHFTQNAEASEAPEPVNDAEGNSLDSKNLFKSWAISERRRCIVSCTPARTMDEVVEDDPFRVILVSDIEDFLITFPQELRSVLLDAFLLFCHLPPTRLLDETGREWANDAFVGDSLHEVDPKWMARQYFPQDDNSNEEEQTPIASVFQTPSTNFQGSPESMFGSSWFKKNRSWRDVYGVGGGPVKYEWLRNSLKQILQVFFEDDLAEYYLAFEWQNEPATIKKVSRNLLKQHPSSLRLYNAYGMIEWSRENREAANSVLSAAVDMCKSLPDSDRDTSIILWKSWIWSYLEVVDKESALTRLLSIESGVLHDGIQSSPFQLLKARQYLEQRRDYNLYSGGRLKLAILYAELLALLLYLTSNSSTEPQSNGQGDITSAMAVYTSFSNSLSKMLMDRNVSDRSHQEIFLQSAARLLYHHCRIGPFRPALLREHLTNYLSLFPQNTIFLSLYTFNETRLRIDNRVRNILSSSILTPRIDTLPSRLFAIRYEIMHGNIHSARAAFEHAVTAPSSKSSPGLWRLYMLYIFQTPHFVSQAKDVWYRALRACPRSKELFILGFERLGDRVEFCEVISTWKVMSEKGLRVHVDLEDMFDDMKSLEVHSEKRRIAHR